uniref:Uncharacterized protein n=1 Tax=Daphnia galeata TaxID=27404 RepID=A0A8J2WLT5_9CRUS|nr:unnamed protein product [Daphnia galeata]
MNERFHALSIDDDRPAELKINGNSRCSMQRKNASVYIESISTEYDVTLFYIVASICNTIDFQETNQINACEGEQGCITHEMPEMPEPTQWYSEDSENTTAVVLKDPLDSVPCTESEDSEGWHRVG